MVKVSTKVKMPDLTIKQPSGATFWKAVALEVRKSIRKRTETQKVDIFGRAFKSYSPEYRKKRTSGKVSKPGGGFYGARTGTANLSLSTKMLASMRDIGRKTKGIVRISGFNGFKAYVNELKGRVFFGISKSEANKVANRVADEVAKINKLSKR